MCSYISNIPFTKDKNGRLLLSFSPAQSDNIKCPLPKENADTFFSTSVPKNYIALDILRIPKLNMIEHLRLPLLEKF